MDVERIKAEIVLLQKRMKKSVNPFQIYTIEQMIAKREEKIREYESRVVPDPPGPTDSDNSDS